MKQIQLENVEAYLNLIKSLKQENLEAGNEQDFLFRGQTSDSPLLPKICRLQAKTDLLDTEIQLLKEFKRTNPLLIKEQHALDRLGLPDPGAALWPAYKAIGLVK